MKESGPPWDNRCVRGVDRKLWPLMYSRGKLAEMSQCVHTHTDKHSCKTHTCRQALLSGVSSCQALPIHARLKHSPRHGAHASTAGTRTHTWSHAPPACPWWERGMKVGSLHPSTTHPQLLPLLQWRLCKGSKRLSGGWEGGRSHQSSRAGKLEGTCANPSFISFLSYTPAHTLHVNNAAGAHCTAHTDHGRLAQHSEHTRTRTHTHTHIHMDFYRSKPILT